jgi:hypothetical protein
VPCIHDLGGNQDDAKRDNRLNGRAGYVDQAERRGAEREAVRNGECRHCDCDAPPVTNEDHQRKYEQR